MTNQVNMTLPKKTNKTPMTDHKETEVVNCQGTQNNPLKEVQ